MAAVDPIVNAQLCKLFPALTSKQVTNFCFYSLGVSHSDSSSLVGAAPVTIKKSLESVQKHFNAESLPELKTVFWAGIIFRAICLKYGNESEASGNLLHSESMKMLKAIFPELNKYQIAYTVTYALGRPMSEISIQCRKSVIEIERYIQEAMAIMGATSKGLLRALVTNRLILDLC